MEEKNILLGILKEGGYLRTASGRVLLAKIPQGTDQQPESDTLEIPADDIGKMALLRGNLSEGVLYSSEMVELLSPTSHGLVQALADKGVITMEEFNEKLAELEVRRGKVKLCALVIGHKKSSPGAKNTNADLAEFDFNEGLAKHIEKKVNGTDIQRVYRRTWSELPGDINQLKPDFVVSLHCNAFNSTTSGTEVPYYHKSQTGKRIAEILQRHLVEHLKLPDRGIKAKTAEDRGGSLLRYTNAPCVIAEPFFIDNDSDLARARENPDGLALAYAKAIEEISKIMDG